MPVSFSYLKRKLMENNEPKLDWKFMKISKAITYRLGEEPEIVHFIKTGFSSGEPTYHVVEEDAYGIKPDVHDRIYTSTQIKKKFDINIDTDFNIIANDISDNELLEFIGKSLVMKNGIHHIDFGEVLKIMDHSLIYRFCKMLSLYSQINGIPIVTAVQKQKPDSTEFSMDSK